MTQHGVSMVVSYFLITLHFPAQVFDTPPVPEVILPTPFQKDTLFAQSYEQKESGRIALIFGHSYKL